VTGGAARADDADGRVAFGIHDGKQTTVLRESEERKTFLAGGVTRVGNDEAEGVAEDRGCVFERDLMFGQVGCGFSGIPFELQRQVSL